MSRKPDPRAQEMPLDRAILWNPSIPGVKHTEASSRAPYPIFFQQEAVIALQEHVKSSPTQAIFGFLVGDLYRDPENGVLYSIIDKTLKLSQTIYGDKTEVVVARLWDRMQEQLAKAAGTLLGWYHSHPGQGGLLTAHDIETHEKFFTDPWHVTILVAAEAGGVTGKFFRTTQGNEDWHKTPLAFYELLQPESIKPDGKKRSFITWRNYKAYGPTLKGPKPKPPEPPPAPPPPPEPPPPAPKAKEEGKGFRIMRGSADDIPVVKSSADDEPAPAPKPEPPPPPLSEPPKPRPAAPVFVPDTPPAPKPPPPPPLPPPPPPPAAAPLKPGDLPWMVTPESVASVPPPLLTPPSPPPQPRRTPTHTFRLLDEEEGKKPAPKAKGRKRRWLGWRARQWIRRSAFLLLLAGAGAGGYWYFVLKNPGKPPPWAGWLDSAKKLVSRVTTRSPRPPAARRPPPSRPPPAPPRRTTASAPPAASGPVAAPLPPPPAPQPVQRPPPPAPQAPQPPVASPFARFDRLSDSLTRAVRSFQDRATLFDTGRLDCNGLATGLVAIENLWITYNAERRARMAAFDQRRATQDQALYASVDAVESRFERSGCPRP